MPPVMERYHLNPPPTEATVITENFNRILNSKVSLPKKALKNFYVYASIRVTF
jgi:hypothetical protein